jgi:hypothetical protein
MSTQYYTVARPAGRAGFYGKVAVLVAAGALGGFLAGGVDLPRIQVGEPVVAVRTAELPVMDAGLGFWDVIDTRPAMGQVHVPPDESTTAPIVMIPPHPPYLEMEPPTQTRLAPAGAAVLEMMPAARENPYEQHPEGVSAAAQQRHQDAVAARAESQQRYWDALEGRPVAQVDESMVGRVDLVDAGPALPSGGATASTTSGLWAESLAGAIAFGGTSSEEPADGTRWVVREGSQGYETFPWAGTSADGPMALLRE